MKVRKNPLTLCAVLLALVITGAVAHAQSKLLLFSSTTKAGQPVPSVCIEQEQVLRKLLAKYPHPANWTYVIACEDTAWAQVERKVGIVENSSYVIGLTNYDPGAYITYFKGSTLTTCTVGNCESDHVVAHELAHIALRSRDEAAVDALAQTWMAQSRKATAIY